MRTWPEYKISTVLAFLIIILIILPTGFFVWRAWKNTINEIDAASININIPRIISTKEKLQIQNWISKNNLNQYGDPQNTIYAGGSPLFDESTGQTIDLYSYILGKHPDRPWKK